MSEGPEPGMIGAGVSFAPSAGAVTDSELPVGLGGWTAELTAVLLSPPSTATIKVTVTSRAKTTARTPRKGAFRLQGRFQASLNHWAIAESAARICYPRAGVLYPLRHDCAPELGGCQRGCAGSAVPGRANTAGDSARLVSSHCNRRPLEGGRVLGTAGVRWEREVARALDSCVMRRMIGPPPDGRGRDANSTIRSAGIVVPGFSPRSLTASQVGKATLSGAP